MGQATYPEPSILIGGPIFRIRRCATTFHRLAFAELCAKNGITKNTTVIFYGDKSNWWSCYALWTFRLFGHEKVKIMDGGRDKWITEGRPLTREVSSYPRSETLVPSKALRPQDSSLLRANAQAQSGEEATYRRAVTRRIQGRNHSHA